MKRILFVVVMLLAAASFAMAQKNAKLEAQLIQMDKDWTAAELRGDAKAAGAFIADDYWQTTPDGMIQDRAKYMSELQPSKDTDVADQYVVRFFGNDVAVMTHRGTVTGEVNRQYRSTHVWVNRGGKWQIVAHHSSDIGPAPKSDMAAPAASSTKMDKGAKAKAAEAAVAAPADAVKPD